MKQGKVYGFCSLHQQFLDIFFSNGDKITSLIDVKDCINTEPSNVTVTATTIANKIIEAIKNI